ncbi:MAG: hypothetical protein LBG80_09345 [Bacteroidales bacterium]|jgi:hypothetical protein|nr:hypothetical protein [Bacteroidales bacterium]
MKSFKSMTLHANESVMKEADKGILRSGHKNLSYRFLLVAVLVSVAMSSFFVACSSDDIFSEDNMDSNLEMQIFGEYLSFSSKIDSKTVGLPEEDVKVLVLAFQRIKLIKKDGLYQMLETSANQINVSEEVFTCLDDMLKISNKRILEYGRISSLIPRLKDGVNENGNENRTSNDCVAQTIVNIAQFMGMSLDFYVVKGWIVQQHGANGVPSGSIQAVINHYFSSSPVTISNGYTPPSGKQVFVVFNYGNGTGHAARYLSCSNDYVLCNDGFYLLGQVSSAYLISSVN